MIALALLCGASAAGAAPKVIRPPAAQPEPAKPATKVATKPAAPATAAATARPVTGTKLLSLPTRRPIVLDALHVEGKTDAPRVLFVHAGPNVALEDAPAHPSDRRDDVKAALSSPVRVRVRGGTTPRATTTGGSK
jgi:hypothetical protein